MPEILKNNYKLFVNGGLVRTFTTKEAALKRGTELMKHAMEDFPHRLTVSMSIRREDDDD